MISPSKLRDQLAGENLTRCFDSEDLNYISASGSTSTLSSLHFTQILNATELMIFLYSINAIIDSKPKVALLVLNSFSFPFSTLPNPRVKPGLLQQVKQILTQVSAVRNVTVKLCL